MLLTRTEKKNQKFMNSVTNFQLENHGEVSDSLALGLHVGDGVEEGSVVSQVEPQDGAFVVEDDGHGFLKVEKQETLFWSDL